MSCPPRVEGHLKKLPGVESAKVDFDSKTATVVVNGPVTDDMLVKAVANDVSCTAEVQKSAQE